MTVDLEEDYTRYLLKRLFSVLYSVLYSPGKWGCLLPRIILGFNTRSILLRLVQHPRSPGRAPSAHCGPAGALQLRQLGQLQPRPRVHRGPAAVAAAAGCKGSRFLAIGTAPTAVCAACSAPQPRPPHPFRDTNPGAAPQPHAHREPSGGHAARQALDASPSPQAAGPRQPDLDKATTTPSALGVLDLRGSSAERHVFVGHGN